MRDRLAELLDPGLTPTNPLDVWGRGTDTEQLFTDCLRVLADDAAVRVVALAVDLVPEFDADDSFPQAVETVVRQTDKPVVVLANLASAVDQDAATRLRGAGVPVLEGTRSGLRAMGHLLRHAAPPHPRTVAVDSERRERWRRSYHMGRPDGFSS